MPPVSAVPPAVPEGASEGPRFRSKRRGAPTGPQHPVGAFAWRYGPHRGLCLARVRSFSHPIV